MANYESQAAEKLNTFLDEYRQLVDENARLKQVLGEVAKLIAGMPTSADGATRGRGRRRRGRPPKSEKTTGRRRGRPRSRITDPATLERRRAALARAREALAQKRASQRATTTESQT
jgi:hypothetical protein